jgi:hypothetical protein
VATEDVEHDANRDPDPENHERQFDDGQKSVPEREDREG